MTDFVPQDDEQTVELLQQAAQQGDAEAQHSLA